LKKQTNVLSPAEWIDKYVTKDIPIVKETDIQNDIMGVLVKHNTVAWAMVTNTGIFKTFGGAKIRMGFDGLADIVGQMVDGRALVIEVKKPKEKPREDQYDFLRTVALNNGLAFWADSAEYVKQILEQEKG